MMQIARNMTMADWGFLEPRQYVIHDRDGKFCPAFQQIIDDAGITRMMLPPQGLNVNALAERWVRSVKGEVLLRLILFGKASLYRALTQYVEHFHHERSHQGKGHCPALCCAKPERVKERSSITNGSGGC
jgi:transposase InsO family protein